MWRVRFGVPPSGGSGIRPAEAGTPNAAPLVSRLCIRSESSRTAKTLTRGFFFLSPRRRSGERTEDRGNPNQTRLLSPALSSIRWRRGSGCGSAALGSSVFIRGKKSSQNATKLGNSTAKTQTPGFGLLDCWIIGFPPRLAATSNPVVHQSIHPFPCTAISQNFCRLRTSFVLVLVLDFPLSITRTRTTTRTIRLRLRRAVSLQCNPSESSHAARMFRRADIPVRSNTAFQQRSRISKPPTNRELLRTGMSARRKIHAAREDSDR